MYTAHETILSYMILKQNHGQVGYPMLNEALTLSWYMLYKKTKESIVRKWIPIENGVADYPKTAESIFGFFVVDHCGDLTALTEDNQKNILPPLKSKCKCSSCNDGCLCNSIEDIPVQTDVIIEGQTYQNKSITRVLKNGDVVEQSFTWVPDYGTDGQFKGVIEIPHETIKCKVDVKPCGCPVKSDANIYKLHNCGCVFHCDPQLREHFPAIYNGVGYYKLDDQERKIYFFDSHGRKSNLTQGMISFQSNGSDMIVQDYARPALFALLDWTVKQYSPIYTEREATAAMKYYYRMATEMRKHLYPIPYEYFIRFDDATKKGKYYNQPHSDFVKHTNPFEQPCNVNALPAQNITNITYSAKEPIRGIVGGGGPDDPVVNTNTFQSVKLKNLGGTLGRIKIQIDDVNQSNWGQNASFIYNKTDGIITFIGDYVWQPQSSLFVDTNQ